MFVFSDKTKVVPVNTSEVQTFRQMTTATVVCNLDKHKWKRGGSSDYIKKGANNNI